MAGAHDAQSQAIDLHGLQEIACLTLKGRRYLLQGKYQNDKLKCAIRSQCHTAAGPLCSVLEHLAQFLGNVDGKLDNILLTA